MNTKNKYYVNIACWLSSIVWLPTVLSYIAARLIYGRGHTLLFIIHICIAITGIVSQGLLLFWQLSIAGIDDDFEGMPTITPWLIFSLVMFYSFSIYMYFYTWRNTYIYSRGVVDALFN